MDPHPLSGVNRRNKLRPEVGVILECLKPTLGIIVNETAYEFDEDVFLKGGILRNVWGKTLDAILDQRASSFQLNGLLTAFDRAYVDFEQAYVGFLISVDTWCKSILIKGIALVAFIDDGYTPAHEYFVAVLQERFGD